MSLELATKSRTTFLNDNEASNSNIFIGASNSLSFIKDLTCDAKKNIIIFLSKIH